MDYENQKVFLSKKARGKGKGKWIGFGGKIEAGESADQGAARELREESNLSIAMEQLHKVGLIMYNYSDTARTPRGAMHVYTLDKRHFRETDMKMNDEFVPNSGQWFGRHDVPLHVSYLAPYDSAMKCCTALEQ